MAKGNEKKKDFFWLSYSDLMTSLFFVMLVLFVLVYSMQKKMIEELTVAKEELDRIRQIEDMVKKIDKELFTFDSLNKKHILNVNFLFNTGSANINRIKPDKRPELIKAGEAIKKLILAFHEEKNIKYLVVVEGQASKDNYEGNNKLSYYRAQSLIEFWEENNIGLEDLKNCEIVIAGSGEKGIPRDEPDRPPANQRFLITIVPKIGEIGKVKRGLVMNAKDDKAKQPYKEGCKVSEIESPTMQVKNFFVDIVNKDFICAFSRQQGIWSSQDKFQLGYKGMDRIQFLGKEILEKGDSSASINLLYLAEDSENSDGVYNQSFNLKKIDNEWIIINTKVDKSIMFSTIKSRLLNSASFVEKIDVNEFKNRFNVEIDKLEINNKKICEEGDVISMYRNNDAIYGVIYRSRTMLTIN